jgi:outer membrane protein assembly factor BamB
MTSETLWASSEAQGKSETTKPPRYWPGVVLTAVYWTYELICRRLDLSMGVLFLSRMAALAFLDLGFTIWWLTNRRIARGERWFAVAVTLAGAALVFPVLPPSGSLLLLVFWLPRVFTAGGLWLLVSKKASPRLRRWGLGAVVWLLWVYLSLLRWDGLSGDQQAEIHWRWEPTAEELFLREQKRSTPHAPPNAGEAVVEYTAGDWPEFRGPHRDGRVETGKPNLDWQTAPPRLLWKKRVGPGWSSVIVVGGRLFTQEQRGPMEAVVCYEAATGRELWAHEEPGRFDEGVSGPGPRATPTFAGGRLYAASASGKLSCLDAASGRIIWTRDLVVDSGAAIPQWGFSSSPLVIAGLVVAFAGGQQDCGLLAYRAETGEPVWTAATGKSSYSSPQAVSLDGTEQVLFLSDRGLVGIEPSRGTVLWEHFLGNEQTLPMIQPHVIGDTGVLIQSGDGLSLLEVRQREGTWTAQRHWRSRALRPSFNDVVVHKETIYGFDEGTFCCIDLQTGARRWKKGRYGHGQVVLLTDSSLLLVAAENGQVVLLEANPNEHTERGRFQAIKGKTWNHPVLAHGRLYLRNSDEIACYELGATVQTEP